MILWSLLIAHFVCDFPLQGDFLARGKNHKAPLPNVPWMHCLLAHAFINGGGVALVTGRVDLGMAEVVVHMWIDWLKCEGAFGTGENGFCTDQVLHVAFKVAWYLLALWL